MLATALVLVSLAHADLTIQDEAGALYRAPVLLGAASTPTPAGQFTLRRAYSKTLERPILIFKSTAIGLYAIHRVVNVQDRQPRLDSPKVDDNYPSHGCINVSQRTFDHLWALPEGTQLIVQ
jgi:hypothetical protein